MGRRILFLLAVIFALALPGRALASGGKYTMVGGTSAEQAQVHAALNASSFDWNMIPQTIQVKIEPGADSSSTPGVVVLDAGLLDTGQFSWGIVQHEFGHQVDFFLLDDAARAQLQQVLGGQDWCYSVAGLSHSSYGCERFASMISWAYWTSPGNVLKPISSTDEAGAMAPAAFRTLLTQMIGARSTLAPSAVTTAAPRAFAPKIAALTPAHKLR